MRLLTAATASLLAATPALADQHYSTMIAETGLSATAATLDALPEKTPSDQFALGGVRFLGAVEGALQQLYATQIDQEMARNSGLPFLRLPLPPNPDAAPFRPELIAEVFQGALTDLEGSLAALDTITDGDDVGVTINLGDIWFDINANGTRDMGEDFATLGAAELDRNLTTDTALPTVRFDTADAAWLSAYAHLLSGVSETALALDPTSAIARVVDSRAAIQALGASTAHGYFTGDDGRWLDLFAMFAHAIEGQPDVTRSRAAHAHFSDMIADNQVFWARVATETDDKLEWIPNPAQTSALPIPFPPDIGATWRAVLDEADAVLKGDLLLPHWRLDQRAGINLAKAMQNPGEVDIIAIIQGEGILPYAEQGPRVSGQALRRFNEMLRGDALLYMIVLN